MRERPSWTVSHLTLAQRRIVMSSTNDWRQYESRGAALLMRQKRLALDKARRAAEASENISVPVDVLRRKQAQLRGDAATTSADRRPLRIVTSKTATNTLLRWTSGVPARWLASLPLRVPPSEFDDLEVEPLDLELRRKVWLREKTARLVGRDATLALAQRAETDDDESAVLNAFAEAVETAGTLATEAAEELRDAREVAARHEAGIAEVVRALQRSAAALRSYEETCGESAAAAAASVDADGAATALAVKDATALLERAAALRAAAEVALPAEADRGYEAEEDEGAVEAAQLLASTRAVIAHAQFLEKLSHGVE